MKQSRILTPRQYSEINGVAYTTVMNWLRRGMIPDAVKHMTPTGHYWVLPETSPSPKLRAGRPPKAKVESSKADKKRSQK